MPIGKDSITKRVAKPAAPEAPVAPEASNAPAKEASPAKKSATEEKNIAPELVATTAAAPAPKKAPAKKTSTTKKTTSAAKKSAIKVEKLTPPTVEPETDKKVGTAVLGNVSPETVKAVIGHEENKDFEKTQIGEKMPVHLL